MFQIFQSNKAIFAKFPIESDIHAHLIPGIDDGPKTMEESVKMIEKLVKMGYQKLTATPHVFSEYYPNSSSKILHYFNNLDKAVKEAQIPVTLEVAAEYFLDAHFLELLDKQDLLTLNNNQVLVEFSTVGVDKNSINIISQIIEKGYQPILAHPERYLYLENIAYHKLLRLGCIFQINILSIAGYYGKNVQRRASKLIRRNWVHYIGTDAHSEAQVDLITTFRAQKSFLDYVPRFRMPLKKVSIF